MFIVLKRNKKVYIVHIKRGNRGVEASHVVTSYTGFRLGKLWDTMKVSIRAIACGILSSNLPNSSYLAGPPYSLSIDVI
jgi:hypothetical protein